LCFLEIVRLSVFHFELIPLSGGTGNSDDESLDSLLRVTLAFENTDELSEEELGLPPHLVDIMQSWVCWDYLKH
jgi:hypothetical protein